MRSHGPAVACCIGPVLGGALFLLPPIRPVGVAVIGLSLAGIASGLLQTATPRPLAGAVFLLLAGVAIVLSLILHLIPGAGLNWHEALDKTVSVLGAGSVFLAGPIALAYNLRANVHWRVAMRASIGLPAIFLLSVAIDGPIIHGAGAIIDGIDSTAALAWIEAIAVNLLVETSRTNSRPASVASA